MKITVLTENAAGGNFFAEHGLSYLIQYDGKNILFDTGHSDVFLRNSAILGIDLPSVVDVIVLSHGHWDHGDGLRYIGNKVLITHPASFIKRYRRGGNRNIGLALSKSEIEKKFRLITSDKPYYITDKIIYAGGIPRSNDFESKETPFVDENGNDDFVPDDSALIMIKDNELIIISGCAHSGICNITDYAKKISKLEKVKLIMGGFHLKNKDEKTRKTVEYFKQCGIENIFPSHCTELPALCMFYEHFNIQQLKTGQVLTI
jgi:7,8-dihydropterin-6-yl-methyl-4-(beta-D-ribofuranosyl)aminobenzene 5'-phosphate synthase